MKLKNIEGWPERNMGNDFADDLGEKELCIDAEKVEDIVFENHHGKTLGDCAKNVAEAIAKADIIKVKK